MAIATINNPRVTSPAIESKAIAEQVNLLFLHSRVIDLASIGVILFLVVLFRDIADAEQVIAWAILFCAIELLRFVIDSYFHNAAVSVEHARRWLRIFRISNVASASGWGLAGIVMFSADSTIHQLLLAAILVGAVAVKVAVLASDYRSFVLFTVVAIAPIVFNLLLEQVAAAMVGAAVCIFVAIMLASVARRMFIDTRDALCMRFAFADMAEEYAVEMTTRINAENTLRRGEQRGRKQSYALLDLAKEEAIANGDLPRALQVVTEKAALAIRCTRVSVWFCDQDFTGFRCVHLYNSGSHDTGPGIYLGAEMQSKFFQRLERTRTFAVDDTGFDQRVCPFVSAYLAPYRISAILGAPFRQEGKVRGVIVMEHVGLPRTWTRDERMFASSLSDFMSLALASSGRQQAQEQLRHLANYDRLTALPNRALFHDRLEHALVKAERAKRDMVLLFVDIDRFKSVNDSFGHNSGDRVLRAIAKRLTRCVRKSDTVARLGGDEFTVILEELDDFETVITICERIIELVAEPLVFSDKEIILTCSIGVASYPRDGRDGETLLQNADTAMYRAKKGGRNQYQFFTQDMHVQTMERLERENDLRKALQRNEFKLVYQPQINTSTGETVGMEALVRWQHPVRGLVSPYEFIPLAEETGLITKIGEWVLREACKQACVWREDYHEAFHMAVNLSVGQFIIRDISQLVNRILEETGLPASALLLEITESLAVGEAESTLILLEDLKALGCRLALDDFGTGNSSLSYLKRFPVDIIKIDRSFVHDLKLDAHDAAIAKATIGLARSLKLEVIAEGVENEMQMNWLRDEGCGVMQGYLFSEPLPAEQAGAWLGRSLTLPMESKNLRSRRRNEERA